MPVNTKIANENFDRYCYARDNGHLEFVNKADQCDAYFAGSQWSEATVNMLKEQGKPVLTINKVLATMAAVFGEQLDNRVDIGFKPGKDGSDEVAAALSKLFINIHNTNRMDWKESDVAADGFITSRGFYDIRPVFDDHMRGEASIRTLNPRNVVIDPDAESYDPDEWKEVFVTKWLSYNDIAILYNEEDAKILKGRGDSQFHFGYDSMDWMSGSFGSPWYRGNQAMHDMDKDVRRLFRVIERQHKKLRKMRYFVDLSTGDTRLIPDTWSQARINKVSQAYKLGVMNRVGEAIRWTVTVDDIVLFDDWSPLEHFTVVPYFPFFRHGTTIGLVEHLLSPQDQLNKASSQELHVVNTTANSGWKIKSGSLQNMTPEELEERGATTGLVMELNDPRDAEKIQPNQIPTGLDRISYKADEFIKEISGVSDSMRGFDRADVAAKAIQAKQARGSVNLAKPFDNLNYTRHLVATRVLSIVQKFYTEERIVKVTGRSLNAETEDLRLNYVVEGAIVNDLTVGEYEVTISTVPARETYEQSQFDEALRLRELGVALPDSVLIEHSHLNRKKEIADEVRQLTGGGEPTQEQLEINRLELQLKQLEAMEKQVLITHKQADAELIRARAQKERVMAAKEAQLDDNQGELRLKREVAAEEIALKREKMHADIVLAREAKAAELALKREEARENALLKRTEARERIKMTPKPSETPKAQGAM